MSPAVLLPAWVISLKDFLCEEWADAPGRWPLAWRFASAALLVVLISMSLQIPFAVLSVVIVFFGTQPNVVYQRLSMGVLGLGLGLTVLCMLLIFIFTYDTPLLRLSASSLILLVCMYMMRIHKLGLTFFMVALSVIYGQTTVDSLGNPEIALRVLLWNGVAGLYPLLLLWLMNVYLFPADPGLQLQAALRQQLAAIDESLARAIDSKDTTSPIDPSKDIERNGLAMQKLLYFACAGNADYRALRNYWQTCMVAVPYLRQAAHALQTDRQAVHGERPPAEQSLLHTLRAQVKDWDAAVARGQPYQPTRGLNAEENQVIAAQPLIGRFFRTLQALGQDDLRQPPADAPKESMFVADARSNPVYWRFALKVLLASLVAYVFYHGAQWDGIHTIMLTCVIVASAGAGATVHKMGLRAGGVLIGAVCALLMSLFVMPYIDGIVGLLLMLLPVFLFGGWVAAGSERSAYIGTQLVITFSLALLEHLGPVIDLTEIRDRFIGIVLGTLLSTVIYLAIWPESEADALRRKLADTLIALGDLLARATSSAGQLEFIQQHTICWMALNACRDLRERVANEVNLSTAARMALLQQADDVLGPARQMLDAAAALHDARSTALADGSAHNGLHCGHAAIAAWQQQAAMALGQCANHLLTGSDFAPMPLFHPPAQCAAAEQAAMQRLKQIISHLSDASGASYETVPAADQTALVIEKKGCNAD